MRGGKSLKRYCYIWIPLIALTSLPGEMAEGTIGGDRTKDSRCVQRTCRADLGPGFCSARGCPLGFVPFLLLRPMLVAACVSWSCILLPIFPLFPVLCFLPLPVWVMLCFCGLCDSSGHIILGVPTAQAECAPHTGLQEAQPGIASSSSHSRPQGSHVCNGHYPKGRKLPLLGAKWNLF